MKVHNGYLYVASYYNNRIFRLKLSNGNCDWNTYARYPNTLDIQNNHLYSLNRSTIIVRNLSTGTDISCSYNATLRSQGRYAYGMAVDHNASNMYLQYYRNLYRFTIGSNKCPTTSAAFSVSSPAGYYSFGMKMHPENFLTVEI